MNFFDNISMNKPNLYSTSTSLLHTEIPLNAVRVKKDPGLFILSISMSIFTPNLCIFAPWTRVSIPFLTRFLWVTFQLVYCYGRFGPAGQKHFIRLNFKTSKGCGRTRCFNKRSNINSLMKGRRNKLEVKLISKQLFVSPRGSVATRSDKCFKFAGVNWQ